MTYPHLKDIPVKERPRKLMPAYSKEYFREGYLWTFLVGLLLIVANGTFAGVVHKSWWVLLWITISSAGYLGLFVDLCSGRISSSVGTYFRETEPVRYWIDCVIQALFILAFCGAVWVV